MSLHVNHNHSGGGNVLLFSTLRLGTTGVYLLGQGSQKLDAPWFVLTTSTPQQQQQQQLQSKKKPLEGVFIPGSSTDKNASNDRKNSQKLKKSGKSTQIVTSKSNNNNNNTIAHVMHLQNDRFGVQRATYWNIRLNTTSLLTKLQDEIQPDHTLRKSPHHRLAIQEGEQQEDALVSIESIPADADIQNLFHESQVIVSGSSEHVQADSHGNVISDNSDQQIENESCIMKLAISQDMEEDNVTRSKDVAGSVDHNDISVAGENTSDNNNNNNQCQKRTCHYFASRAAKIIEIPDEIKNSPLAQEVEVAVALVWQVGQNMLDYSEQYGSTANLRPSIKTPLNSDFDTQNFALISNGILEAFPRHKVLGRGEAGAAMVTTETSTWFIDSDASENFRSGLPLACIGVSMCLNGMPTLGIVYAPMTAELYIAVAYHGAYRNGARIRGQPEPKPMSDCIISFEFGNGRDKYKMLNALGRTMERGCYATRSLGSVVLDLCYLAAGRLDAVYAGAACNLMKPWNCCPGVVIAVEAGCVAEPLNQEFDSHSILCAASRPLLDELRQCIVR